VVKVVKYYYYYCCYYYYYYYHSYHHQHQARRLPFPLGLFACHQIQKEAEEDAKSAVKIKRPKRKGPGGYIVTMTVAGSELYDFSPACPSR